jgi:nucleoside recognition membrane protein YjiH
MNKNTALKIVNPVLALLLLIQPFSGLLLSVTDWETLEDLHVGGGIALIVFAAIHLMLNWNWVKINLLKSTR